MLNVKRNVNLDNSIKLNHEINKNSQNNTNMSKREESINLGLWPKSS